MVLEIELNKLGRSAPVHTDYLDLSIGGTLSVGGYGVRSIVHGAQIDQVERLRLILPNGSPVWCSLTENRDLFRLSLAGLGQVGVIEKIIMHTVPYRKYARTYHYAHRSLTALVQSLESIESGQIPPPSFFWGYLFGSMVGSIFGQEYVKEPECSNDANLNEWDPEIIPQKPDQVKTIKNYPFFNHEMKANWISNYQSHARPWMDYCLDYAGLISFVSFVETLLHNASLQRYLGAIYILIHRKQNSHNIYAPLAPSSLILAEDQEFSYGVGFYWMIPQGDIEGLKMVRQASQTLLNTCVRLNGRPYLYGWYELDEQTKHTLYGDDVLDDLIRLRQELDPHGLFNKGAFQTNETRCV